MKIQTDYYGEVEYDQEDLVTISGGFFGFSDLTYYLPICLSEDEGSLLLMQSTEQPDIAFVVINPAFLSPDYSPILSQEELACLDVSDSGELSYYALCVILENPDYGYRQKISSFPGMLEPPNTEARSDGYADTAEKKE